DDALEAKSARQIERRRAGVIDDGSHWIAVKVKRAACEIERLVDIKDKPPTADDFDGPAPAHRERPDLDVEDAAASVKNDPIVPGACRDRIVPSRLVDDDASLVPAGHDRAPIRQIG